MKNVLIATSLLITALTTFAFKPFKNGKIIMIISIEVKDFTAWKKSFDVGAPVREKAGIKVLSVCSSLENKNQVTIIEEAENAQTAYDFIVKLKSKQKEGDMSKMDVKLFDKAD